MKTNKRVGILTDKPFLHTNSWVSLGGGRQGFRLTCTIFQSAVGHSQYIIILTSYQNHFIIAIHYSHIDTCIAMLTSIQYQICVAVSEPLAGLIALSTSRLQSICQRLVAVIVIIGWIKWESGRLTNLKNNISRFSGR